MIKMSVVLHQIMHLTSELINDFFLRQVNSFLTRLNNILDLIFTKTPECVSDLSLITTCYSLTLKCM